MESLHTVKWPPQMQKSTLRPFHGVEWNDRKRGRKGNLQYINPTPRPFSRDKFWGGNKLGEGGGSPLNIFFQQASHDRGQCQRCSAKRRQTLQHWKSGVWFALQCVIAVHRCSLHCTGDQNRWAAFKDQCQLWIQIPFKTNLFYAFWSQWSWTFFRENMTKYIFCSTEELPSRWQFSELISKFAGICYFLSPSPLLTLASLFAPSWFSRDRSPLLRESREKTRL